MALLFDLWGNSLDARHAVNDATHGVFGTGIADPVLETSGWTGELNGSSIKQRNGANTVIAGLVFAGRKNTPASAFSINFRVGFAVNTGLMGLFCLCNGPSTIINAIQLYYSSGTLHFIWVDNQGNQRVNVVATFTPTVNRFYDIFVRWDATTGTNKAQVFADASLLASGTSTLARPADDRQQTGCIVIGATAPDVTGTAIDTNGFTIWDSYEDPTAIPLVGGTGALNGSSRTQNINSTAFDGALSMGAGAANIRTGVSETIAGVVIPGTLVVPTLSNTKTGVAGDGGAGTYDGSDRWTALTAAQIKHGLTPLVNAATVTGTYQGDDVNDVIDPATLKHGVSALNRNVTVLGTYRGADLWSAIAAGNIKLSFSTTQDGSTVVGTYAPVCDYAAESDTRENVVYADGAMTGALDLPAVGDTRAGVSFDGNTKQGTMEQTIDAISIELSDDEITVELE